LPEQLLEKFAVKLGKKEGNAKNSLKVGKEKRVNKQERK